MLQASEYKQKVLTVRQRQKLHKYVSIVSGYYF